MESQHLLGLSLLELEVLVQSLGQPRFRARQIWDWLYTHLASDFGAMTNVPKALLDALRSNSSIHVLKEVGRQVSSDGTTKWAFETHDGHVFEAVLIPSEDRRSICMSSQIGCAMGCTFCRTATMGFIRNLTLGEILEQAHRVARHVRDTGGRLSNVIFMGMGEPLHNLESVAQACERLSAEDGFGIGKSHITVSTSGIVPKMLEWAERAPDYKLAVSLNGSNDTVRSALMPVNRRWPIASLLEAADAYIEKTGQVLTFEYVLIAGKTCTPEAAAELRHIAAHRNCKVNLIPLNAGNPDMQAPSENEIAEFERLLRPRGGFQVLRRRARGPDIMAACGQLAQQVKRRGIRPPAGPAGASAQDFTPGSSTVEKVV
jgi:23S rRNA (adenine2503-C2)-methyltransferase